MMIKIFSAVFCFLLLIPTPILAASDTIVVRQVVYGDSVPPTTPTNLIATPITSDQIDVSWDASSDNVSVGGYVVFRDAAAVATTTLTSYSDTGLVPETLYTYSVVAFDLSTNYSSSSATTSTSTLAAIVSEVEDDEESDTGGSLQKIRIFDLSYEAEEHSIVFSYNTNAYTRAIIRWGRTRDYEGGYIVESAYKRFHTTNINNLDSGTVYEIEIELVDRFGRNSLTHTLTVVTPEGRDNTPPPNVSALNATLEGTSARLSWINPSVDDFSRVRVMSSDVFYSRHTADGWLVYEGVRESLLDERPIDLNSRRYYTVFAYDTAGNVSSGAVVYVTRGELGDEGNIFDDGMTGTSTVTLPFGFDDINFIQDGEERIVEDGLVVISSAQETKISLPYQYLPEHLKTIIVTLTNPADGKSTYSFLLRINAAKTAYEARIAPLAEALYDTSVDLFDFQTKEQFVIFGYIKSNSAFEKFVQTFTGSSGEVSATQLFFRNLLFSFLLLLLVWIILWYRRRESNDEDSRAL